MNSINNNFSFKARVRMSNVQNNSKTIAEGISALSSGTSTIGSTAAGTVGTTVSHSIGSAANVVGSAFSAKASGVDSFGIVPSVIESASPHVTPATVASAKAHPSVMGSIFSTIGDFFHSLGKVNVKVKDPS